MNMNFLIILYMKKFVKSAKTLLHIALNAIKHDALNAMTVIYFKIK